MIYVWAAVIAISLIVEFATQEFVSIWFAASGVVSLILAFCKVSIYWQIPVFIIASLALIFATRPLIKKFIKKDTIPTNADSLIGKTSKLISDITLDQNGSVKFKGVEWTATSSTPIKQGEDVEVVEINGNTLTVKKVEPKVEETKIDKK